MCIDNVIIRFVDYADTPFKVPHDSNCFTYTLKYPITLALWLTVPDCRKHSKLTMLTFTMCIVWIGLASYAVAMVITIIGKNQAMSINDLITSISTLLRHTVTMEISYAHVHVHFDNDTSYRLYNCCDANFFPKLYDPH